MTKPVYTSAARQDLADILAYIARDKPRAAAEWVEKIEAKYRTKNLVTDRDVRPTARFFVRL